jgi:hypothetical protein
LARILNARNRLIPTDRYEKTSVEGWTVYVHNDLLADGTELGVEALLKEHGYNPDKAQSVEIGNASQFLSLSVDHPGIVLHLLADAYYDRVLGYDHEGIQEAFRAAVERGRYETVLRLAGREDANAIKNERVYFVAGTEAFFSTDDDVRDELRREDPKLFELLEEVW